MLRRKRVNQNLPIPSDTARGEGREAGPGTALNVGQRAAVYGAPYVSHSGELVVPQTLAVPVPDTVDPLSAFYRWPRCYCTARLHSAEV